MYQSGEVKQILLNVIAYLENQRWGGPKSRLTFNQWFYAIEDSLKLLRENLKSFDKAKTPVEKSILGHIVTPFETFVVIDFDRLEREVLKGRIADEDVQRLLPFQTRLAAGDNHIHIRNESAYTVETNSHYVRENDTLCMRQKGYTYATHDTVATCPGCLVKAKAIIVNHLLGDSKVDTL